MLSSPRDFPELLTIAQSERLLVLKHCRRAAWQQLLHSTQMAFIVMFVGMLMTVGLLLNMVWLFAAIGVTIGLLWARQQFNERLQTQLYLELKIRRATQLETPKKNLGDWLRALPQESLH